MSIISTSCSKSSRLRRYVLNAEFRCSNRYKSNVAASPHAFLHNVTYKALKSTLNKEEAFEGGTGLLSETMSH